MWNTPCGITCGIPQGTVLGPMLFSLYINDLPSALSRKTIVYADDTALLFRGNSLCTLKKEITAELAQISAWFARNKLALNVAKTKYIIFHSRRKTYIIVIWAYKLTTRPSSAFPRLNT